VRTLCPLAFGERWNVASSGTSCLEGNGLHVHQRRIPSVWLVDRLQLLENPHFVHRQVRPFAQNSVQRGTWCLQFGRFADFLFSETHDRLILLVGNTLTPFSWIFSCILLVKHLVKPSCECFFWLVHNLRTLANIIFSFTEVLHFCIPRNNSALATEKNIFRFSDRKARTATSKSRNEIEFQSVITSLLKCRLSL
jgi:hypothetical protein